MKTNFRKYLIRIISLGGILLLAYGAYYVRQLIPIGQAYTAKILCSGVFLSKRAPMDILSEELNGIANIMDVAIDPAKRSVTVAFPWLPPQRAVYREQMGCTVLPEGYDENALKPSGKIQGSVAQSAWQNHHELLELPDGTHPPDVSSAKLDATLDKAFSEQGKNPSIRTRAVVVALHGRIIAERYAAGFSADAALPGWSMTKSVVNALVGILVKQGKLAVDRPAPVAEWSGPGDLRKEITLDHLLHMSSGLEFDERSGPFLSDVNMMLLRNGDTAAYAVAKPLRQAPGTYWKYSSGTTNIVSRIIRECVGGGDAEYHAFPRKALFEKVGMTSAVMEVDASGTFIGSSFMYATARDWARFGMLYLHDGVWKGERILPEGWAAYSAKPAPAAPKGVYGAHFWTNGPTGVPDRERPFPRLPVDTFYASGYEGQYIVIIPSRGLVVVRLGLTKDRNAWNMEVFVSDILDAISENKKMKA
jgi:CubicO group peptidase (beta-lactamase class C family)